ncbi:MAG: alpha-amylase family glycosyl hydrolase [Alphaproteobacteria bacterium]|nr:alpha-amylase family glycosyl hydrolase [Alphaproteobacteria bacterium]
MKIEIGSFKFIVLCCFFNVFAFRSAAQLLTPSPFFFTENTSNLTITANTNFGNKAFINYNQNVYVHIGVITSLSTSSADWKYVKFTWGTANPAAQASKISNYQWQFSINQNLRQYFGLTNINEKINKIVILFRSGNGQIKLTNSDGSDMYLNVFDTNLNAKIITPAFQPTYNPILEPINIKIGDSIQIQGITNKNSNLELYHNGTLISANFNNQNINIKAPITNSGLQTIILKSNYNLTNKNDTVSFLIYPPSTFKALPPNVRDGINYESGDTSVILVQYAPFKKSMVVLGDFNNWTENSNYIMNLTPDSQRFWIRISGLKPNVEYAYQFLVDGTLKVGDIYTNKVLDPWNDSYIPNTVYPNLKPYPTGLTSGIVSIIQTAKPQYVWKNNTFTKPNSKNLIIYELLVRDFVSTHSYRTLIDTLNYLKNLGINAIELMPISEFEGNESWGYNPNYFFAVDKYYGTEYALKEFIDSCHSKGIAVILDMVLNHCFGSCPLAQLYWDAINNRPATNNPWLNPIAKHPFNVGNDFNHESPATQYLTKRVMEYWIKEFKFDGFRFDLSKGFTQVFSGDNVDLWGKYDASRIKIWKNYYDTLRTFSPDAYCILEHFAENSEEVELANYGMMLWGNANYNMSQASQGYSNNNDFSWGLSSKARGWGNNLNLVSYQESHDEERIMYNNLNFGTSFVKNNLVNSLNNMTMNTMFWALTPGPKMMWQFGEYGYDKSINDCGNGTVNNNCRLSNKPILWNYLQDTNRQKLLKYFSEFAKLKTNANFSQSFINPNFNYQYSGFIKYMTIYSDSIRLIAFGNYAQQPQTATLNFPAIGIWYDYFKDTTLLVTSYNNQISLKPGEFHLVTNKNFRNYTVPSQPIDTTKKDTTIVPPPNPIDTIDIDSVNFVLNKAYPNPSSSQINIKFNLPKASTVSFNFVNDRGGVVYNFTKLYTQIGEINETIYYSTISQLYGYKGILILELKTNFGSKIIKLIKY